MPSVDVAMVRSLRGGLWGTLTQGLTSNLGRRNTLEDLQNSASEAKTAFSSWDNCMQATFCKWPVIAIIIIGGLIIFSIVCRTPMKAPVMSPVRTAPVYEPPQYAEFEVAKKGGEDSLPSMPVWNEAGSKKATLEQEAVEMNQLSRTATGQQTVASASAAAAASAAAVAAAAGQPSPASPQGYGNGYSQTPAPYGADPYIAAAAVPNSRMASPRQDYRGNGYNQGYGNGNGQAYPDAGQGYANGRLWNGSETGLPASAAYAAEPLRHSPAPQAGYGYGQQQQPQQQQQQYGAAAGYRQPQPQQPQLQNTGGFDFSSGYSRPQEYNNYRQPSPVEVQPQELPASTGYAAYSPTTTQRNNGY
ncbi:unnamed protein product [Parascedosporium putredinis]|uniref:Fibroin-3 n=1 Tax=Parascedosporium putredinis TaxID=1442378 RepID=A0A9P1MD56_9PEZI|nr:unnamed protein product [Parascedosporium putredinis]CAI7998053.1 unnamed protein product [Parascedosporium putredinis]